MTLVGCIGGGQLGRMLGLAGIPLGLSFRFLDPSPDACAREVGDLVVADYGDHAGLERLARGAGVVTFEFENVPVEAAAHLRTVPGPAALEQGQDRLREKELFRSLGIPTARFGTLEEAGLPALVKSRRLGYDGKGQRRVEAPEPLAEGELAEELVPFDRELSIVGVRGRDGDTRFWPVGENVHRDGILRVTRVPAADAPQREAEAICTALMDALEYVGVLAVELFEVEGRLLANEFAPRVHNTAHWTIDGAETSRAPQREAEAICTALMDALDYVGVLAVELFEVGGRLLANEFAPRVHNTAHWTIDASSTSQFENHLRAILGLPLGSTDARAPCVMVNLIGSAPPLGELLELPRAHVHLYGKDPREGRKVGHVTLVDPDEETTARAVALAGSG